MLARRYEFYVFVARTTSHSFASLTREILFLPLEHKIHIFSPPRNILYLSSPPIFHESLLMCLKEIFVFDHCYKKQFTFPFGIRF